MLRWVIPKGFHRDTHFPGFHRDTHFPIDTNQPSCGAQLELRYKDLADDPAKMALISLADIPYCHIASGQKCLSQGRSVCPILTILNTEVSVPYLILTLAGLIASDQVTEFRIIQKMVLPRTSLIRRCHRVCMSGSLQ